MKSPKSRNESRSWWGALCFLVLLGAVFVGVLTALLVGPEFSWKGFHAPDDIEAGRELLTEKFAGPRYFQYVATPEELSPPFIPVAEARQQIKAIAAARQLSPAEAEKLNGLVESLAEPSRSRIAGVSQVNTLRLNLALDEQK